MKKHIFFTAFLICLSIRSFGQMNYEINFDTPFNLNHLFINPAGSQPNKWQIGTPKKKIFKSAYSSPKVIVTDTLNSYPIKDTAVFIVKNTANAGFTTPHTVILSGRYYVNSDSLSDIGSIEFSPNNGKMWIDLINPGSSYSSYIHWSSGIVPVLTGNSNEWKHFSVQLAQLGPILNIKYGDTVLYKFTFRSDAIQTNKDGLMYDNLNFEDYLESVPEIQNDNLISIYPNPSSEQLIISEIEKGDCPTVQILNSIGQVVYAENCFQAGTINISELNNGMYYLKYI